MKRSNKIFITLLTIVYFITPVYANLNSTFDNDSEGWTVWDPNPNDVTNFRWVETSGNPGGFIAADDVALSDTFWFRSPQSWGGDWRQYIGGTIEWDIFLYPNYPFEYYSQIELIIDAVGTGNYLSAELDIIPDINQWTHFKIDITRENLTVHGDLTFDEIIQNVDTIFIRGEFSGDSVPDSEGLDNVYVSIPDSDNGDGDGSGDDAENSDDSGDDQGIDCSDIAGEWEGNWSEISCDNSSYSGLWRGTVSADCEFIGTDDWDTISGTVNPSTMALTATGISQDGCGSIAVSGTFTSNSVSGNYNYSAGGGGTFSGDIIVDANSTNDVENISTSDGGGGGGCFINSVMGFWW